MVSNISTYSSTALKCGVSKRKFMKLVSSCLILFILAQSTVGSEFESVPIVELADANFEHDTQAATGQTTGRWLVLFTDFSHPTSSSIQRSFKKASSNEDRGTLYAKVDLGRNPKLRKRFEFTKDPTIVLFRDRKMFLCENKCDSPTHISEFAKGGFRTTVETVVPTEPSFFEDFQEWGFDNIRRVVEYLVLPVFLALIGGVVALAMYAITARLRGLKESPKRASTAMRNVSQKKE